MTFYEGINSGTYNQCPRTLSRRLRVSMPLQPDGKLVELMYALLGHRVSKVIAWGAVAVALLWGVRFGITQIKLIVTDFSGSDASLSEVGSTLAALAILGILTLMFSVAVGVMKGVASRIAGTNDKRLDNIERAIEEIRNDILEMKQEKVD